MYRAIALDLDGTLLKSDKTVSERSLSVLKECAGRGMKIALATGRPPRAIRRLLPPFFQDSALVCYNGAEVYEKGERLAEYYLSPMISRQILDVLDEIVIPGGIVSLEMNDWVYVNQPLNWEWPHTIGRLQDCALHPVSKILVDVKALRDPDVLRDLLPDEATYIITSGRTLVEIQAKGVCKEQGMRRLLDRWGISFNELIAFGDDTNDIEIIRESGTGVAMANSVPELLAVADKVTKSNDDDGVAFALEELLAADSISK